MSSRRTSSAWRASRRVHPSLYISILCILLAISSFAADRAHVVIIAIDDSGSMKQSDPQRMRLEAAAMLAASAGKSDQLGIVKFGDDASWLAPPAPISGGIESQLAQLKSSDQHTNFVAPLQLITQYLDSRGDYFKNYDVSVVLMTDGAPDPAPQYTGGPAQNRAESLNVGKALALRGVHLYTVGLGAAVESDFLKALAAQTDGFYAPARSARELRDAFLKTVTRIFSLPAYEQFQGVPKASIHIGPNVDIVRAYLFRQGSGTTLVGDVKPVFASEHIATYDLPSRADISFELAGPTASASVIVCVKQPLSFAEESAVAPSLLVDSSQNLRVRLLGGGEPQWNRLFMRDAAVAVHLRSAGQADIVGPLYPDSGDKSYRGALPTNRAGEFDATVRMESPYGAVDYFLSKVKVADSAVDIPQQVSVSYPSFLPASTRGVFGEKIPFKYLLPAGSARIEFETQDAVRTSSGYLDVAAGEKKSLRVSAGPGDPSGTIAVPYTVTWSNGQQKQVRRGILSVQVEPQGPFDFGRHHWLAFSLLIIAIVIVCIYGPKPKLKGVLVIDQGGSRKRVVLDELKAKRILIAESADRESLRSDPVLVRTGFNRNLFTLTMVKVDGVWGPRITRAEDAPVDVPTTVKNGTKIRVKDRELTFTLY